MKLIVLLLVASVFSSLAFADTLKIVGHAEITNQNLGEIRVSFGTNKELARAWVEVLLVSQVSLGSDSPPDEQVLRIKLDPLTFDQGTNSILVQTSRGPVHRGRPRAHPSRTDADSRCFGGRGTLPPVGTARWSSRAEVLAGPRRQARPRGRVDVRRRRSAVHGVTQRPHSGPAGNPVPDAAPRSDQLSRPRPGARRGAR